THKPIARMDQGDLIYKTEDAKFQACIDDIVERNAAGQPVLVGTVSVEKSEKLSRMRSIGSIGRHFQNCALREQAATMIVF
ncbi:MAG: hypothetical protein AAGG44_16085, partial [Planctomycetota bacterium]